MRWPQHIPGAVSLFVEEHRFRVVGLCDWRGRAHKRDALTGRALPVVRKHLWDIRNKIKQGCEEFCSRRGDDEQTIFHVFRSKAVAQ